MSLLAPIPKGGDDPMDEIFGQVVDPPPPEVVWQPLPGSQAMALSCPCNVILFEGARGPGKTDWQLMHYRKTVGMGYGQYWRGVIFDREYKNLDDIVVKSERWFPRLSGGGTFLRSAKDYKWVWPTGEALLFRAAAKESDYWDYHGQEFPYIGWNELSKYATRKLYDLMMSCNRSSFLPDLHTPKDEKTGRYKTPNGLPLPEIPLTVTGTTNPYGPGHNWVKKDFITKAPPGRIVKTVTNVFNPRTQEREDVTRTQVRIFGSYKENIYLSPAYIAFLESIKDPNRRRAWLYGDWDIVAGGAIDDVWDEDTQIIPRFPIPAAWRVDRSFDWGSTQPFSVGWWAETDGGEIMLPNRKRWCPPKGSIIRINEWYGTEEIGSNEGLKMSAGDVASGILKREAELIAAGWIAGKPWPGPADNAIRNVIDKKVKTIEQLMADRGVTWTESDKRPGSRKNQLELVRNYLEVSRKHGRGEDIYAWHKDLIKMRPKQASFAPPPVAGLYIMEHCKAAISTLPVLPRDEKDPDDVDTTAEDHPYDDTRYRVADGAARAPVSLVVKQHT